ncbi:MAG: ferrous iron transport protein B [Candidatus Marinimicrobia bacterium]|jgi:ferrous iron transport protein B|nr:ferrous iron transport protein B [Candidatus Neomarinimicrobiota bacterium]MBT3634110.1 ferrous iron transport protein B [Candidatus Neomarinimicrobiota bacterium]MBT3683016.1 ferrous iron transport protein B [Candidatus Neomarinimicrobiota bacterium]MBT3759892.1 ferrous iron transport protein B [Candidatus Neomarinimicrobiota bacterium]MBT3895655.1 ferrous iron transport protein B [Candidatus Neomarinimicrobiota bacterium]
MSRDHKHRHQQLKTGITVALLGNPNSGKTAIFNQLTKLRHKVSNYPGVTVEQKSGLFKINQHSKGIVTDYPGTYSITPESLDERIVAEEILQWIHGNSPPDVIISVVDASNLSRNLYLTTQLTDLGIPVVLAMNMMDRVQSKGTNIDIDKLKKELGVAEIISLSAKKKWGFKELRAAIDSVSAMSDFSPEADCAIKIPEDIRKTLQPLILLLEKEFQYSSMLAAAQALRIITRNSAFDLYAHLKEIDSRVTETLLQNILNLRDQAIEELESLGHPHRVLEGTIRYQRIDDTLNDISFDTNRFVKETTKSERVDKVLTHRYIGPTIFVLILYFIFNSVFTWATIPMDWISLEIAHFGEWVLSKMNPGSLRDLFVDGIIGGVGAILVFLPQILILVFFLTILEDSGYMARVAFMMDRIMTKVGLHGKSVLPLMSGYACAIPGIMATRTIDSWKDRLITILVLPLMSCSARLPVYSLLIGSFIPATKIFGLISMQGFVMVIMYFLGTVTAFLLSWIFSKFIKVESKSSFVMELPPYRIPIMGSVFHQVYSRGKLFVKNAGQIILAISIVLWFIASYPQIPEGHTGISKVEYSYAGRMGKMIEPVIEPLGFDWKIGIGLITSFAAREVMVSTLATLYNIEDEENIVMLRDSMKSDVDPITGDPRYSALIALSLMVFYVYAAQCLATFAIVRTETNSWKWPMFMMAYMTILAFSASSIVYQGGRLLGY